MSRPLAIDLFCGLGGWAEGFLSEGYDVIGFDNHRHVYGEQRYPGQLVIQDVLTLHGSQFRNAACIVASPPCQKYSYMAMPWSLAKREVRWQEWERDSAFGDRLESLNALFAACFRIQREASEAAGHHIPMVVENVKGAQKWVGRAAWHHGSFFLWGDVPALMPHTFKLRKVPGFNFHQHENGGPGGSFQSAAVELATKNGGGSWFNEAHNTGSGVGQNPVHELSGVKTVGHANKRDGHDHTRHLTNQRESDACKVGGDWFGTYAEQKAAGTISPGRLHGKNSESRKAASAMIAKIPPDLSAYIARYFKP